jgi:putative NADPH-quinone reductase
MKKICILLGHPNTDTLSGHFASVYEAAAKAAGHEVRRTNIGEMQFDPILHKGYKEIQQLEPDLKKLQEDIKWADHFFLIYPLWWSSMPALLKGLFDRMWLPAFGFRFHKNGMGWDRLLKGRTARVVMLSKEPGWIIQFMFGDFTNEITRAILQFSGFKVALTEIGGSENLSDGARAGWEKRLAALGAKAK